MRTFETAADRWAGIGPYYAMFPVTFANRVIATHTKAGQVVLDPFAGRGTAVFSAASQSRTGIGIEINPVGWVYSHAKLFPARRSAIERRFQELGMRARHYADAAQYLPPFFQHCFSRSVRRYLMAAREELDWRRSTIDCTTMAILLVYLHGKAGQALSNQMRQTKAMSPTYAINWWRKHDSHPPDLNPTEFLMSRLDWRYAKGLPECDRRSQVYLGDSAALLKRVGNVIPRRASLLFTSPPYYGLTNYHYDQWLRLWLLGEAPDARRKPGRHRAKFENRNGYEQLLRVVFTRAASLLTPNATVYVRTGRQQVTRQVTREVLREVFPKKRLQSVLQPFRTRTQTSLFGDHSAKLGEVDLILRA
jgi:hypothetical protein